MNELAKKCLYLLLRNAATEVHALFFLKPCFNLTYTPVFIQFQSLGQILHLFFFRDVWQCNVKEKKPENAAKNGYVFINRFSLKIIGSKNVRCKEWVLFSHSFEKIVPFNWNWSYVNWIFT